MNGNAVFQQPLEIGLRERFHGENNVRMRSGRQERRLANKKLIAFSQTKAYFMSA